VRKLILSNGKFAAAWVSAACMVIALPVLASRPYAVDGEAVRKLEVAATAGQRLITTQLPVISGNPSGIELERFEVWAKDARIVIHDAKGIHEEAPPARYFYKGRVLGQEDSMVFLSVDPKDARSLQGMIIISEQKYFFGHGVRRIPARGPGGERVRRIEEPAAPMLISQLDASDDVADPASSWRCAVDQKSISGRKIDLPKEILALKPVADAGGVSGAAYSLRIAIETDFELYTGLGSTSPNVTTYISNLVGAVSTIYQRDVNTTLTLGNLGIYTSAADPYTVLPNSSIFPGDTHQAMAELSKVWHTQHCTPTTTCVTTETAKRSAVVLVSGKAFNGGVGWVDALCLSATQDFYCGDTGANCGSSNFAFGYSGSYAFCGSLGSVTTTVPNPDATVNGVQYALPNNNNFWMLLEFAHELGHVVGENHTQCTALTAGEKTTYSTTRNFVDECFNGEGGSCFSGSPNFVGACFTSPPTSIGYCAAPPELGTIMSYCHNVFCPAGTTCGGVNSGTFRQSRYLFGKAGEPSFKMLGLFTTLIDAVTPNGTITAGSNLLCAAGQTASVPSNATATFAWQITGGSITSSTTTNSITFTPSAPSVTLTVTITSANGCAITTSKIVTTQCGGSQAPPTNVVATATSSTSVSITWTAASGASSYQVFRATTIGGGYTQIGTPAVTNFTDNTVAVNTAYLYKVRAVGSGTSVDSNIDLATTVIFQDATLTAQTTMIKAAHITELRVAVNAVRTLAGLSAGSFTDPTITAQTTVGKAVHVSQLRTALDAARTACALSALSYTDPTLTAQTTQIKAIHLTELRNGVK
jgi:hypothetical protein